MKAATRPICSSHSLGFLRRRRSRSNPKLPPPTSIASEVGPCGVACVFVVTRADFTSVAMVRVSVEVPVPLGVTDVGLNVQVLFAGRPEHVRVIAWLNPPDGVMVTVDLAEDPGLTEPAEGLKETVKSAAEAAATVTTTADEEETALAVSPP